MCRGNSVRKVNSVLHDHIDKYKCKHRARRASALTPAEVDRYSGQAMEGELRCHRRSVHPLCAPAFELVSHPGPFGDGRACLTVFVQAAAVLPWLESSSPGEAPEAQPTLGIEGATD